MTLLTGGAGADRKLTGGDANVRQDTLAQEPSSREQAVQGRQQIAGLETLARMCIDSADTYKLSRCAWLPCVRPVFFLIPPG